MSDTATLLIAKGTLVLLLVASALTWALVIVKALQQWRIGRQNNGFPKAFAKSARLPALEEVARYTGPVARLAQAGVEAWRESALAVGEDGAELEVRRDLLERSLRRQLQKERRGVEAGLPILASVGSTAPFVGLFGTVLGIIHALQRIGSSGSASLEVVAGPIGEALVATGIGIAVAVPAVLAYNFFLRSLKALLAELDDFANAFVASAIKSSFGRGSNVDGAAERPLALRREASA
jgi:biopolymer transport protein ExbB